MEKLETLVEETLRVTNNILDKLAEDYPHAQNMLLLAKQILDYESVRELIPDIVSKESGAFDKFVALVDAEVGKFLQFGQKLPTESSPKQLEYTVCEKCNNRNEELLDTVCQLEQEVYRLKNRKTASGTNTAYLVEANKNLQHNEALAAARIKELEQNNDLLTEECNSLHDILNAKENNMAKLDITMDELGAGDMAVRGVSIVIDGISAEDAARVSLRLLSAIDPMEADDPETPQHVCTCHASDEDKRPPENKIRVIHHPGKTSGRSSPEERHEDMKENALFPGV